jgi:hypothetical protein
MGRLGLAFRCFFRVLAGKPVPEQAMLANGRPALPAPEDQQSAIQVPVVQLLSLLQKEGRLLDFLQEDIDAYEDAQVGAAVRSIHQQCRQVLHEHVGLAPVLQGEEESQITIEAGFDPSRIRLIGNVTGDPPFTGLLKHHGWQARQVTLPRPAQGHSSAVIFPAEVEIP